jgi:parallel beta-helix repeat protein
MTQDHSRELAPNGPSSPSVTSRLAERTLAERATRSDAPALTGRTLIVGPGGFSTIGEAVASAQDGSTVLVRPGTYRESVAIDRAITLAGDGDRDAIVVLSDDAPCLIVGGQTARIAHLTVRGGGACDEWGGKAAILVSGGSPILDGLVLAESHGIRITKGASPTIHGCVVRDGPRAGIWAQLSTGIIEDNDIFGNALFGIVVRGTGSAPLVRANRVRENDGGVWVSAGASPVIEDNDIYCNITRGIWVDCTAPQIRANRIRGGRRYGIVVSGFAAGRIEANDIFGNAGDGIAITDLGGRAVIRANRIRDNGGMGIRVHSRAAGTIENNEFTGNAGGAIAIEKGATPFLFGNTTADAVQDPVRPMTKDRSRAIVPQSPGSLSVTSRLAQRTLAERVACDRSAITVLVVDDIQETRDRITRWLSFESSIQVVGEAVTGIEALELAHSLRPKVVLMGYGMTEMDGLTATEILLERMLEVAVIVMSIQDDGYYISRAFRAGARGYLLKPFSHDELTTAIRDAPTTHTPTIRGYGTECSPGDAT